MMPISRALVVTSLVSAPLFGLAAPAARAERGIGTSDPELYGPAPASVSQEGDVSAFYGQFDAPGELVALQRGMFVGDDLRPAAESAVGSPALASARAGVSASFGWLRAIVLVGLALLILLVPLAGVSRAALPANFVGVTAEDVYVGSDAYQSSTLARQRTVGVQLVRQVFRWPEIEPVRGAFDFSATDRFVLAAARAQVQVMPVLFGEPAWATSRPAGSSLRAAFPPRSFDDFAAFARAVAVRYGPGGTLWAANPGVTPRPIVQYQLWNEPNLKMYWGGRVDPKAFARMITTATAAIRSVVPSAVTITGGVPFSRLGMSPLTFLTRYLRAGGRTAGATIGIHPYAQSVGQTVKLTKQFRTLLDRRGGRKIGLWVTELGWAAGGPRTAGRTVSAKRQASLIAGLFPALARQARSLRLGGVVYYAWRDLPPYPGRKDFWGLRTGLVNRAGKEKPAVRALQRSIKRISR